MRAIGNAELDKLNDEVEQEEEGNKAKFPEAVLDSLAGRINHAWQAARSNKQTLVKERLMSAQRSRKGEYSPQKLADIRSGSGGSEEYGRVVSNKCRIAEAWLKDVYLGQTEKAWTLSPTPVPSLSPDEDAEVHQVIQEEILSAVVSTGEKPPPDIIHERRNELTDALRLRKREQAKLAVERMEDKMADQLTENNYREEMSDFLSDFVTYPAAHFKGPTYRMVSKLEWEIVEGEWVSTPTESIEPVYERVDPFRAYPAPEALTPQDGYWIEHISLERKELYALIGAEGFNEDKIREVLADHSGAGLSNWLGFTDADEVAQERGETTVLTPEYLIDALEFYGPASGKHLREWGMSETDVPDEEEEYEVTAWLIGRHVIKAQLNPDPLGKRPIYKACWEEIPGEYWGQGLPDGLRDIEGVTNAGLRALVNNMAMASGPQVAVNVDRLPAGETIDTLHPWKVWQTQDAEYGDKSAPVTFFQPDMNSAEIIGVLDKFYQYADDWSLIPRYLGGSDSIAGGIGRTASGMSMLFNAANKGLKGVVSNIDTRVLSPALSALYTYNMMFEPDPTIKGDAQVQARGAVSLMQLETLQLRRNEFLQATNNETDMSIIGQEGRAEVLREVAKGLEMDTNRVVPRRSEQQQAPPQAVPPASPASAPNQDTLLSGDVVTNNFGNNELRST